MKLIVFDIDGTLTDTKGVDDKCFIQAFHTTFGLDIQDQIWADLQNVTDWGITEEIIQQRLGRATTALEYAEMHKNHTTNLAQERLKDVQQFKAVAGANQFIETLLNHPHFRIGIATGAWEKSALIKLKSIAIDPLQYPFSNSDYHKSRENITLDTIAKAEKKYQQKFEKIVYFGDGAWDFKTCQHLNIPFIGIDILGDKKLRGLGAKNVFPNFEDIESILNILEA